MRKLVPYAGIALAVAVGIAVAPYLGWIVGLVAVVAVPVMCWTAAVVVVQKIDAKLAAQQARNRAAVDSVLRPFLVRCERIGARMPHWFFWPRRASDAIGRIMGFPGR